MTFSVHNITFSLIFRSTRTFSHVQRQLQHSHVVNASKRGIPHGSTARRDASEILELLELHELLKLLKLLKLLETRGG